MHLDKPGSCFSRLPEQPITGAQKFTRYDQFFLVTVLQGDWCIYSHVFTAIFDWNATFTYIKVCDTVQNTGRISNLCKLQFGDLGLWCVISNLVRRVCLFWHWALLQQSFFMCDMYWVMSGVTYLITSWIRCSSVLAITATTAPNKCDSSLEGYKGQWFHYSNFSKWKKVLLEELRQ